MQVNIDDTGEDESWEKLTTKQFFSGYSDEDAVYDDLNKGTKIGSAQR